MACPYGSAGFRPLRFDQFVTIYCDDIKMPDGLITATYYIRALVQSGGRIRMKRASRDKGLSHPAISWINRTKQNVGRWPVDRFMTLAH
jgi:hypothetical protein